ncbi:MAG: DUF389 domain-containing protein [Aridibacter sp.]
MHDKIHQNFRFFRKIFKVWNGLRDWFTTALDIDTERKTELYVELSKSATLTDLVYWLQIFFSAGIATLGLVLNSSAVIIGAMLISPLMAPILSQGLSLATGDLALGVRSFVNLFLSTILGISVAVILVALLPFKNQTPEIIARTVPNTLDLVIALFSGAIGSIATCKKVKGVVTSIPGVAIAVALMPPLCVVGYGIGFAVSVEFEKGWEIASGGGLLYLTNLVAITFTAMLVFVLLRIDTHKVRNAVRVWREDDSESRWWLKQINKIPALGKAGEVRSFSLRLLMILLPLIIIFVPLSQSFSKLRTQIIQQQSENRVNQSARNIWKDKFAEDSEGNVRSYLDELKIREEDGELKLFMRIFDNTPYTPGERNQYIKLLANALNRDPEKISLQLIEIPTSAMEQITPLVENTPIPLTIAQRQENFVKSYNDTLKTFRLPPPATLIDYMIIIGSNNETDLNINYLSNRDIDSDGKSALQDRVRELLNLPDSTLSYSRISSDEKEISFKKDSDEMTEETIVSLDEAGNDLRRHKSLRIRFILKPDETDEELFKKKQDGIKDFFKINYLVDEDRLVFDKITEEKKGEIYQFFVRR